jgi:hypothetical protein
MIIYFEKKRNKYKETILEMKSNQSKFKDFMHKIQSENQDLISSKRNL